ncbi:MAG: heme-binding protein [Parvibaculaceae bacterium]
MHLTLTVADTIIRGAFAEAERLGCQPLAVAVLDAGGHIVSVRRQDGASFFRPEVAMGKAWGAVAMGLSGRDLNIRAQNNPAFLQSLSVLSGGKLVPQTGGVLIRAADGKALGAVGISGDSGDNDETCALAGITAAGFEPITG